MRPEPAVAGQPVWVEIDLPLPERAGLRYPVHIQPGNFAPHRLELRRWRDSAGGAVVAAPRRIPPGRAPLPVAGSGFGMLGLPREPGRGHRLPLHLAYDLTAPGRYEVRYLGGPGFESAWTGFEIRAATAGERRRWWEAHRRAMPEGGDPVTLLAEWLPDLLADDSRATLDLLDRRALRHPHELVRQYSLYALEFFPEAMIAEWLPASLAAHGPTVDLAYFVSWRRDQFRPREREIVATALRFLKSPDRTQVAGALQTLHFLTPPNAGPAVAAEFDRLLATHDRAVLQPLALYLGVWRSDSSRRLLRRLAAEGTVREQAEICLRWIAE